MSDVAACDTGRVDGVHDLGGLHGFGPVPVDADLAFHAPWEQRVRAMLWPVIRYTTVDRFRWTIEQMPPAEYLASRYFERWLYAIERLADELGLLDGRGPPAGGGLASFAPTEPGPRRVGLGQRVRVGNPVTAGHTRVPRYARGHAGVVIRHLPPWPKPTISAATGRYDDGWEHVYSVEVPAAELFGDADHLVTLDIWESDLEPEVA
jgi:nitrile hydratase subunit beta